jgi:hypothetical protein
MLRVSLSFENILYVVIILSAFATEYVALNLRLC